MKTIIVDVTLADGIPILKSEDDQKEIGTLWDNQNQEIALRCDSSFASDDRLLFFRPGAGEWIEINNGTSDNYTITNALTQGREMAFTVALIAPDGTRRAGGNILNFKYRQAPRGGTTPSPLAGADWAGLMAGAVTSAEYDEDTGLFTFNNVDGNPVFTLPSGAAAIARQDIELTLLNGFVEYGTDSRNIPRLTIMGGWCYLTGLVSPPAENVLGSSTATTILQLPEGFEPAQSVPVVCQGSSRNIWTMDIQTAGTVTAGRYRDETGYTTPAANAWMPFNAVWPLKIS